MTLDLDGTELVVLSACESGLGKAENGEGVYGMRRALALAGAQKSTGESVGVDDDATAYFMESFYTKLKEGKGKAESMKETKLEMRSIEMWENPNVKLPLYSREIGNECVVSCTFFELCCSPQSLLI